MEPSLTTSTTTITTPDENLQSEKRRKHTRFGFQRTADWDFYTAATGAKSGYLDNLSSGGCLLRASEPIEHRRWLRMIVREEENGLWFTTVGRVMRREERMEAWDENNVTLYRYGIEFIQPLNPVILEKIRESQVCCASCGEASASIPNPAAPSELLCVLCHLRKACHNLLMQDGFESA